jgi:basic membrane protein A
MVETVEKIAAEHPDKFYIIYDTEVDYSKGNLDNVYSILFKQNDGSFLAGALAGMITTSNLPLANSEKIISFLGGMDIPVINDSLIAYEQGAQYIDPEIQVLTSYVGAFDDPATGKEMTLAMYAQGADICINPASQSGLGVFDAAAEQGRYAIGYDSDQYLLFADSDPEKAATIVTSMLKNVDNAIYRAIDLHIKGELTFGQTESLGIKEGGVGLADNENYKKIVPEEFRTRLKEIEEKIVSGDIVVKTAF